MAKKDVVGYCTCLDPTCGKRAEVRIKNNSGRTAYIICDHSPPMRGCGASLNLPRWDEQTISDYPGFIPLVKETAPKAVEVPKADGPKETAAPETDVAKAGPSILRRIWDGGGDDD